MKDKKLLLSILSDDKYDEGYGVLYLYINSGEKSSGDVVKKMDELVARGIVERFVRARVGFCQFTEGKPIYEEYGSIHDIPADIAEKVMSLEVRYRLI